MSTEPMFRRPGRDDALQLARAAFLAGERIDMQALASRLGVGRTTLYRWVGSRDELLGDMLAALSVEALGATAQRAAGTGVDRFVARVRRHNELLIRSDAFRQFVAREPEVALRLIMSRRSPVFRRTVELSAGLLDDALPGLPPGRAQELAETVFLIMTAFVSAGFAIGDEPDLDRALGVIRTLLQAESLPQVA